MNWKYCVIRKMNPNRAKNATVTAPLAAENAGVRNSVTSIIGCSRRRSMATNATDEHAATAKPASVAGAAPAAAGRLDDRVDEQRRSRPTTATRPGRSSRACAGSLDSGTSTTVATSASSATGTSARNTDGQPKWASSRPPVTGPTATPRPVTAPQTPIALARSRAVGEGVGDDRQRRREDQRGERAHHEAHGDQRAGAELHSAPTPLAAANPTSPISSAGRRPNRSPSEPAVSTSAAKARL